MGEILETIDTEVGSIRKPAYMVIAALMTFRNIFRLHEASLLIFCAAPQSALDYNPNARNAQTIITEWQLYGTNEWIPGFLQSIYYAGVLIGATVFGQLSDIYGRKIVGMTGYVFLLIIAASMGLAQNWQQLAIFRILLGFLSSQYVADTILFQELCGKNLWAFNGIALGSILSTMHALFHILTAYFFPDWRTLCFVDSALGLLNFIYYYYIPKSPRWLHSKGRVEEAGKVIAKFERWNGKMRGYRGSQRELLVDQEDHAVPDSDGEMSENTREVDRSSFRQRARALDILRNSSLRTRSLILGLQWCGRRRALAICNFLTALSAFAVYLVPSDDSSSAKLILMMIGKLGITLSFDLIYVYTPELFPTAVRNVGLGAMSTSARIGGILAPFLAHVMISDTQTPFILYGVMCTTCGFLGLFLPETVAKKIPESMDDIYDQDDST